MRRLCLLLAVSLLGFSPLPQSQQVSHEGPTRLQPGLALYIESMPADLHIYIAAEITKDDVPVRVVMDESLADIIMIGAASEEDSKWYHTIFGGQDKTHGSVMILNRSKTLMIWATEAGDRSLLWGPFVRGGPRKLADRIVNNLKDAIKNREGINVPVPPRPAQATQATQPVQASAAPSSAAPATTQTVIPVAPLPASDERISVGALPSPSVMTPVLQSKAAHWTTRVAGKVGYQWEAEIANTNNVAVKATVTVRLNNRERMALHQASQQILFQPETSVTVSGVGEMDEEVAVQGDHWIVEITDTVAEGTPSAPGEPALGTEANPAPITADVKPPGLIQESVTIILHDVQFQQLDMAGRLISILCLVSRNGTVVDARVYRIDPQVSAALNYDLLKEGIRQSAIESWRCVPALKAGKPVAVWYMATVRYEPGG